MANCNGCFTWLRESVFLLSPLGQGAGCKMLSALFGFVTCVTCVTLICHKSRIEDMSRLDYAGGTLAHHAASQARRKIARAARLETPKELREARTGSSDNGSRRALCTKSFYSNAGEQIPNGSQWHPWS